MKIQSADAGVFPASSQQATPARPEAGAAAFRPTALPPTEGRKLSPQDAQNLVKKMNQTLQSINTGLEFSLHEETGQMVIKVVDRETKEVLRQIPSEEAIAVASALDKVKGSLLRQSA